MRLKIPFNNKLIQLYLEKGKLQFSFKWGRKFQLDQPQKKLQPMFLLTWVLAQFK